MLRNINTTKCKTSFLSEGVSKGLYVAVGEEELLAKSRNAHCSKGTVDALSPAPPSVIAFFAKLYT